MGGAPDAIAERLVVDYTTANGANGGIAPVPSSTSIGLTVSPDGKQLLYAGAPAPDADIVVLDFVRQD